MDDKETNVYVEPEYDVAYNGLSQEKAGTAYDQRDMQRLGRQQELRVCGKLRKCVRVRKLILASEISDSSRH